jgi:hypothetical protein
MALVPCVGCRAMFPETEGPVHRYMESSPGCWAAYGEVLTREYSDMTFVSAHRLTVDTYAVQHPGRPSPQSIHSVGLHLVSLCLVLERAVPTQQATEWLQKFARYKEHLFWLDPPATRGTITVFDVSIAKDAREHIECVWDWAAAAWSAWSQHHKTIYDWLKNIYRDA